MQQKEKQLDFSSIQIEGNEYFQLSEKSILIEQPKIETQIDPEKGNYTKKSYQTQNIQTRCEKKQASGSFMKDLQRYQKQLSYESQVYDIYHGSNQQSLNYGDKIKMIMQNQQSEYFNEKNIYRYIIDFKKSQKKSESKKKNNNKQKSKNGLNKSKSTKKKDPVKQKNEMINTVNKPEAISPHNQYFGYRNKGSEEQISLHRTITHKNQKKVSKNPVKQKISISKSKNKNSQSKNKNRQTTKKKFLS